jgi:ABC-type dipeptide/oligopeptide/nickel transport systems, permease components
MGAYAIRRLLWIPVTLVVISIIVFLLVRWIPGDIVDEIIAQQLPSAGNEEAERIAITHALGLDKPFYVQYGHWVSNIVVHGSLGKSLNGNQDITKEILHRLPISLELTLMSLIIGILISIPIGVYAAIRQDTVSDYVLRSIAVVLISVPSFWLGTIIMIYPSIWWGWSPPMQYISFGKDPLGNIGMFLIPAFILGTAMTGSSLRMTRTMMLEVMRQDYTRTAWAKGLTERIIVIRHALKNALIPVITIIGMQIPMIIGGSVIVEQIFVLPGMGRYLLDAINHRDYPIVSGINLVLATFVVVINLIVDLTYGWMDPRIHYQ